MQFNYKRLLTIIAALILHTIISHSYAQLIPSTTIMSNIDSVLRKAIQDNPHIESGSVIVMDVNSGEVDAMVNLTKDPVSGEISEGQHEAIQHGFELGPLSQPMILAMLLDDGYLKSLKEPVPSRSPRLPRRIQDKGEITIEEGLAVSSNYSPACLADMYYRDCPQRFTENISKYCPDVRIDERSHFDVLSVGYGVYSSPLSVLSFYNAIAGKGEMMKPTTADSLAEALYKVTTEGTGLTLRGAKYPVAGKTGTTDSLATYVGFFPVDNPQFSIICTLFINGGPRPLYGGSTPAYITKEIIDTSFEG